MVFLHTRGKIFLFCSFSFFLHGNDAKITINDLLGKNFLINNTKIEKRTIKLKREIETINKFFIAIAIAAIFSYGHQTFSIIRGIFSTQSLQPELQNKFIISLFWNSLSLLQNALISFFIQKALCYMMQYYFYTHPFEWILSRRIPILKHFETLFNAINTHEKRHTQYPQDKTLHTSLMFFVTMIIKDVEKICSFMSYRGFSLSTYKQPTLLLIQENIITLTHEWAKAIEEISREKNINFALIHTKTIDFKIMLFEQIELFKKIDDKIEKIRDFLNTTTTLYT